MDLFKIRSRPTVMQPFPCQSETMTFRGISFVCYGLPTQNGHFPHIVLQSSCHAVLLNPIEIYIRLDIVERPMFLVNTRSAFGLPLTLQIVTVGESCMLYLIPLSLTNISLLHPWQYLYRTSSLLHADPQVHKKPHAVHRLEHLCHCRELVRSDD